jgi:deoxycytidylate deaminase
MKKKSSTLVHEDFEFEVDRLIPNYKIKAHPRFEKFTNIARSVSEESIFNRYRIGAILVVKGKIIARGYNSTKSHPMQKMYNIERTDVTDSAPHYLHAEIDVLTKMKGMDVNLKNAELYIYHINNKGEQRMARPCAACMRAIREYGVSVIHYSTPEGLATEYIDPSQKIRVQKSRGLV